MAGHGVDTDTAREAIVALIGEGEEAPSGHIPFMPRAKKVMELSLREAITLGHNYIGTEHILLGLIREREGIAAQVLVGLGLDLDTIRATVIDLIKAEPPESAAGPQLGEEWPATGTYGTSARGFWAAPRMGRVGQMASVQIGLLALLFVVVSLVAILSPRPPTGLMRTGLIVFIAGVVASTLGAAIQLSKPGRSPERWIRVSRWLNVSALLFFAAGTVFVVLDAALS